MTLKYVAAGDSTVEGLEDPGPDGAYVGWADRLAHHLAAEHPGPGYANLAVRGQTSREVRATQLEAAVALRPDVAVVVAGVNDLLRPRFDAVALREDLTAMHLALHEVGTRVVTFTMPDMARVAPLAVLLRPRLAALNAITHDLAGLGTTVVDLASEALASDPALWHDDRLHANTEGHRRIAAALAEALGVDVGEWRHLPPTPRRSRTPAAAARPVAGEAAWLGTHVAPWLVGRLLGRRLPEEPVCKRPELTPLAGPPAPAHGPHGRGDASEETELAREVTRLLG